MHKVAINIFLLTILLIGLSSCTRLIPYYKPDIQQGNIITQTQVNQLKKGMTEKQVIAILGTPVAEKTFHNNQLIYINTNKPNRGPYTAKRLILQFYRGKLATGQGDFKLPF